jgi:hypothetical protein
MSTPIKLNLISNDQNVKTIAKNQYLDNCLTPELANDFQLNCIMPLTTTSRNQSSNAKYHCTICNYFCHNIVSAFRHKDNPNHLKHLKVKSI